MAGSSVAQLLGAAIRLHEAGDADGAQAVCRDLLSAHHGSADGWNLLAILLCEANRLEQAAQAAERATALRPRLAPYWVTRGNIEADRRLDRAAEASFRRALALDPTVAEAHHGLAGVLLRADRLPEAMEAFRRAFTLDPEARLDRRECIDCFRRLDFESLPEFWYREAERFLERDDIDKARYFVPILQVLLAKPEFRSAAAAPHASVAQALEPEAAARFMRDALFSAMLRNTLVTHPGLEFLVTRLRRALLLDDRVRAAAPLPFLCDLGRQCFDNEFILAQTPEESAALHGLGAKVLDLLQSGQALDEEAVRSLALLATYRPLHALEGADALLAARPSSAAFESFVAHTLRALRKERQLRSAIPVLGAIHDEVSLRVQAQYEENPYPRLQSFQRLPPLTPAAWLARDVPALPAPERFPEAPRVLVAGCGTGGAALALAAGVPAMQVTAIDLSLASLSHARRKAEELGVGNIVFMQADILALGALTERYDVIHCTGVLHHMREPVRGLRGLVQLLRPGGLLLIGLYSELARAEINVARKRIRERGLAPDPAMIRAYRQEVFAAGAESALLRSRDFYSMSGCRDLLFHVQEHQFRLPAVAAMLREAGLSVLNLAHEQPASALRAFRELYPDGAALDDLSRWDAVETRHPALFEGMYQIWCRAVAPPLPA